MVRRRLSIENPVPRLLEPSRQSDFRSLGSSSSLPWQTTRFA
jgi:hypothetical protein